MVRIENECVGCPPHMGCLGKSCPNRNVIRFYCDECKSETDIYRFEEQELCLDCIEKRLEKVTGE